MKEIDKRETTVLLATLDIEIDLKCEELQEKHQEAKLKKVFFLSALLILVLYLIQVGFNIFNINLVFVFLIYQGIALAFIGTLVLHINRREVSK